MTIFHLTWDCETRDYGTKPKSRVTRLVVSRQFIDYKDNVFTFSQSKKQHFLSLQPENNIKTQYYDQKTYQHVTERVRNDGS